MEDKDTTRELDNPQEEKKIKKAVNDISTDLSSLCVDVKSISGQLPSLVVTREEVNTFKLRIEKYDKELEQAVKTIKKAWTCECPLPCCQRLMWECLTRSRRTLKPGTSAGQPCAGP